MGPTTPFSNKDSNCKLQKKLSRDAVMMSVFRPKIQFSSFLKFLLLDIRKGQENLFHTTGFRYIEILSMPMYYLATNIVEVLIYSGME